MSTWRQSGRPRARAGSCCNELSSSVRDCANEPAGRMQMQTGPRLGVCCLATMQKAGTSGGVLIPMLGRGERRSGESTPLLNIPWIVLGEVRQRSSLRGKVGKKNAQVFVCCQRWWRLRTATQQAGTSHKLWVIFQQKWPLATSLQGRTHQHFSIQHPLDA